MPQKTILLVDDDGDDRFFIQQAVAFCRISAHVIEAENGLEMIRLLEANSQQISMIIIDMNMPMMNGLEAIQHIRKLPATASVPVVMISTSPNQDLEERAYRAGVTSFMAKPNTIDEFNELMLALHQQYLS